MHFAPLFTRCSLLVLGLALVQGCDSQSATSVYDNPIQSTGDGDQLVGHVLPAAGATASNGDQAADDGAAGSEDSGGSAAEAAEDPEGGSSLGAPSRLLAADTLQYVATHANLARFVQALANSSSAYGYYDCGKSGSLNYAAVARTSDREVLGWQFSQCVLSDAKSGDVSYNGNVTVSCEREARTSGARSCSVGFSDLSASYAGRSTVFNGQLAQFDDFASLKSESTDIVTVTDGARWTSESQTIASEGAEIRGLSTALISNDALEFSALGEVDYRQSADGCLQAGSVMLKHQHSETRVRIHAQSGGNMLIDDNGLSDSLACDELRALPFTALVLR